MYKSEQNFKSICAKVFKYRILLKGILTFLGFDHRDVLLITLYLVVIGISIAKIRSTLIIEKLRF